MMFVIRVTFLAQKVRKLGFSVYVVRIFMLILVPVSLP